MKEKIIIGITDCSKYGNYEKWILREPDTEVIKLSYQSDFEAIHKCHRILLTGGEDVHPRFYKHPEYLEHCDLDNMDEKRDEFEWKVLEHSRRDEVPLLGICRGLQIANVFFGGTLIPDIPSFGKYEHSKFKDGKDRYHSLRIDPNSTLNKIVQCNTNDVNSSHHQGADKIGNGLVACAFSDDGVVEAIERRPGSEGAFLLLVQWHPERMTDQENPMTKKIKESFLSANSIINL